MEQSVKSEKLKIPESLSHYLRHLKLIFLYASVTLTLLNLLSVNLFENFLYLPGSDFLIAHFVLGRQYFSCG